MKDLISKGESNLNQTIMPQQQNLHGIHIFKGNNNFYLICEHILSFHPTGRDHPIKEQYIYELD